MNTRRQGRGGSCQRLCYSERAAQGTASQIFRSFFDGTRFSVRKWFYFEMTKRNLKLFILLLTCLAQPALMMGQDGADSTSEGVIAVSRPTSDFNKNIYYRNKLEFSLDTGGL